MPGVSDGTRNIDMPWYALISDSDTAIHDENDAGARVRRRRTSAVDDPLVAVFLGAAS